MMSCMAISSGGQSGAADCTAAIWLADHATGEGCGEKRGLCGEEADSRRKSRLNKIACVFWAGPQAKIACEYRCALNLSKS